MMTLEVGDLGNALDIAGNDCRGFYARPVFRGQRDSRWPLRANLFRNPPHLPFSVTLDFLAWCHNRSQLLGSFDDEALLQIAQHYGMSTDLLDFTTEPAIACFFALDHNVTSGTGTLTESAVFVVDAEMLDNIKALALAEDPFVDPQSAAVLRTYNRMYREGAALGLSRLTAQKGVFVRDAHGTLADVLSSQHELLGLAYERRYNQRLNYAKITFRQAASDLASLREMGASKEALFPDANALEREVVRFLVFYPDQSVSAKLAAGLADRAEQQGEPNALEEPLEKFKRLYTQEEGNMSTTSVSKLGNPGDL